MHLPSAGRSVLRRISERCEFKRDGRQMGSFEQPCYGCWSFTRVMGQLCGAGDKQTHQVLGVGGTHILAMGIASFEYHRAHCRTWWRLDINLVRAFPFILAETLLFASVPARQGLSFPAISFVFPGLFCAVGLIFLWDDTSNSTGLIAFGALLFYSALALSFLAFGLGLEYIWALGLTFTIGGLFIVMQTESWSCAAHPVAIGHTIFAFYPAIFALAIASGLSNSKFQKV